MKGSKFVLFSFALTIFLFSFCQKSFAQTVCRPCLIAIGANQADSLINPWLLNHTSITNDSEKVIGLQMLMSVYNLQVKAFERMDSLKSNIVMSNSHEKGSEINELINNNTAIMDLEETQKYYSLAENKLIVLLLNYYSSH